MEQYRYAYKILVGKLERERERERERPLGRPRRRWEDNIKMDLREVGCDPGFIYLFDDVGRVNISGHWRP